MMETNYPFEANPLGFPPRTVRAWAGACQNIRHFSLVDSIGIDFHKHGFAHCISSLILLQHKEDAGIAPRATRSELYLDHFGEQRPGMYTLGTLRPGTEVLAALASLKLFGKEGLRVIMGHIVEMAQLLLENLESHAFTTVLNRDNFGTATLFEFTRKEWIPSR